MKKGLAFALLAALVVGTPGARAAPVIERFRAATLNSEDMAGVAQWYIKWFDYRVREQGTLDAGLARSWGVPAMAGRAFMLLSSDGSPDVYLRIVQGDKAPAFNPRTTYGWGSLEFILKDLDLQYRKMKAGGVGIFREPASLGGIFASIHAMQVFGPMNMTHNLTVETAPAETSNLPIARSQVDRMFLVGLNGPDLAALSAFYVQTFAMTKGPDYEYEIPVLAEALNMPKDHKYKLSLVRSAQKGNTIELHDLPKPGGPRPVVPGQLPPGVAMVSFGVKDLNAVTAPYIAAPATRPGQVYAGRRAATLTGAAGELIELIEE